MRNVEIKAKVCNLKTLLANINKLCDKAPVIIPQHDVFYEVPGGRLKLRRFKDGDADLIFYNRPDCEGPKLSEFEKCHLLTEQVHGLNKVLAKAFGVRNEVIKTRQLFMVGQTRVHVDNVQDLGDFVELEVVLRDEQSVEEGQTIANDLMSKLGINEQDLLSNAYADMLNK